MSFNLLRNLGLAALVLLLLLEVVTEQYTRMQDTKALQQIVNINLPAHKALLLAHSHMLAARHQFDLYDQRERIGVREVEQSIRVFKKAIEGLDINFKAEVEPILLRLTSLWDSYLDEEEIDPVGDETNQFSQLINENAAQLREVVGSLVEIRLPGEEFTSQRTSPQLNKMVDQIEANTLIYMQRRRYSIDPVFAQLARAVKDLQAIKATTLSEELTSSYGELIKSMQMTRSLIYSYLDEESMGSTADSFLMTRDNLYHAWEELGLLMNKTVSLLELQLDSRHEKLLNETETAQQRMSLFAVTSVVLASLLAIVLGMALSKRLDILTMGAQHFAAGDLDYRIPMNNKDNLGTLADTLNSMAGQLQADHKALEKSSQAAKAASQAKSDFLARMSHEIRTPMNGVLGMTELLLASGLSGKQQHYANTVYRSGQILLGIINNILDFSKIEANKLKLEQTPFNLQEVVEDVLQMVAEQARKKQLELLSDCRVDMNCKVLGDGARLRQILTNLVGNAVKFTDQGEVIVRISPVEENDKEILVLFEVRDSGVGIDTEKLAGIFDDFTQADDSVNRRYGGTGLGLAISKQLVYLMGGEIAVESREGNGSTFHFTLRLNKQATKPVATTLAQYKGTKVLVVDDNLPTRRILIRKIEDWGLQASGADCGDKALRLMQEAAADGNPYELAILDRMMPGMDGITLARRIKADPATAHTRLLMYSALHADAGDNTWRTAGVEVYLSKPARLTELHDHLLSLLDDNHSVMNEKEALTT